MIILLPSKVLIRKESEYGDDGVSNMIVENYENGDVIYECRYSYERYAAVYDFLFQQSVKIFFSRTDAEEELLKEDVLAEDARIAENMEKFRLEDQSERAKAIEQAKETFVTE